MALLDQLMELTKDKTWQARIVEAARTVFQDEHVNVNPIPAVMCALLLLAIPLFLLYLRFPLLPPIDSTGAGYDPPSYVAPVLAEYGAPSSSYGAASHIFSNEYRSQSDSIELAGAQLRLEHKLAAVVSPIVNRVGEAVANLMQ